MKKSQLKYKQIIIGSAMLGGAYVSYRVKKEDVKLNNKIKVKKRKKYECNKNVFTKFFQRFKISSRSHND